MEALRYIEKIDSDVITIKNLERFKGREVEIIILPYESQISDYDEEWGKESWKCQYQCSPKYPQYIYTAISCSAAFSL